MLLKKRIEISMNISIKKMMFLFLFLTFIITFVNCNKKKNIEFEKEIYISNFELPNKEIINSTSKDSVEYYLVNWIKDTTKIVNKTTWFNFDKLLFEEKKNTLEKDSENQLKNLSLIMKAFPKLEIKIGSYTDSLEVATEQKMILSTQRAENVAKKLVTLGIDIKKIKPEGYGDQYPVASNKTKEGRAENRRIAVRITKK